MKENQENDVNNDSRGNFQRGTVMSNLVRGLLVALIALAATGIASAQNNFDNNFNSGSSLKFKGGIGVIPVTGVAATGAVNLNIVRGVSPAGPWRIADLDATVRNDGHITVGGRGLLLAAGNGIGTNGGQSVHASLFCGFATTATEHDTTLVGVALAPDGDFRIDDFLTPAPPSPCDTPVLLIRNGGGVWFAAGIQDLKPVPNHY
jgi:hypothetical protein